MQKILVQLQVEQKVITIMSLGVEDHNLNLVDEAFSAIADRLTNITTKLSSELADVKTAEDMMQTVSALKIASSIACRIEGGNTGEMLELSLEAILQLQFMFNLDVKRFIFAKQDGQIFVERNLCLPSRDSFVHTDETASVNTSNSIQFAYNATRGMPS